MISAAPAMAASNPKKMPFEQVCRASQVVIGQRWVLKKFGLSMQAR
jgi:hypothetical protein